MSIDNRTANFLFKASYLLPEDEIYSSIRSRMLLKCAKNYITDSVQATQTPSCSTCGVKFQNYFPKNLLVPSKKEPRFLKKLNRMEIKTKYQVSSLKKYQKYKQNKQILIKRCTFCKNEMKTVVNKPKGILTSKWECVNVVRKRNNKSLKRLQKKKNREFSGLNKEAVLNIKRTLQNQRINKADNSEVICLDTPKKNNVKKFTNKSVPVLPKQENYGEASNASNRNSQNTSQKQKLPESKRKKKKKKYKMITSTPKLNSIKCETTHKINVTKNNNNTKNSVNKMYGQKPKWIDKFPKFEMKCSPVKKQKLNSLFTSLKGTSDSEHSKKTNNLSAFLKNFV